MILGGFSSLQQKVASDLQQKFYFILFYCLKKKDQKWKQAEEIVLERPNKERNCFSLFLRLKIFTAEFLICFYIESAEMRVLGTDKFPN